LARRLNFGVGARFFGFGFLASDIALRGAPPTRNAGPYSSPSAR